MLGSRVRAPGGAPGQFDRVQLSTANRSLRYLRDRFGFLEFDRVVYQISGYTSDLLPQKVHLISSELKSGKSRLKMIEPRPFASIISNKLPYALLVCRPITPDLQ